MEAGAPDPVWLNLRGAPGGQALVIWLSGSLSRHRLHGYAGDAAVKQARGAVGCPRPGRYTRSPTAAHLNHTVAADRLTTGLRLLLC